MLREFYSINQLPTADKGVNKSENFADVYKWMAP